MAYTELLENLQTHMHCSFHLFMILESKAGLDDSPKEFPEKPVTVADEGSDKDMFEGNIDISFSIRC